MSNLMVLKVVELIRFIYIYITPGLVKEEMIVKHLWFGVSLVKNTVAVTTLFLLISGYILLIARNILLRG